MGSQILYQVLINNAPTIISKVCSSYVSYVSPEKSVVRMIQDTDDERELDLLQVDRLLKWMSLIFDRNSTEREDEDKENDNEEDQLRSKYKQELFSIYRSIYSDFKEYERYKKHNVSLWVFSSYRKYDTKALAKRILSDIKLFNEGLKMFIII